jgi:hypothetical protein
MNVQVLILTDQGERSHDVVCTFPNVLQFFLIEFVKFCVISGFRRGINESFDLL